LRDEIFKQKHKAGITDSYDINMADAFMVMVRNAKASSDRSLPPERLVTGKSGETKAGNKKPGNKTKSYKRHFDGLVIVDWAAIKRGWKRTARNLRDCRHWPSLGKDGNGTFG